MVSILQAATCLRAYFDRIGSERMSHPDAVPAEGIAVDRNIGIRSTEYSVSRRTAYQNTRILNAFRTARTAVQNALLPAEAVEFQLSIFFNTHFSQ